MWGSSMEVNQWKYQTCSRKVPLRKMGKNMDSLGFGPFFPYFLAGANFGPNPGSYFFLTNGSFLLTVELFYLQLAILASLLTVGAFLLTVLAFLLTVGAFLLTVGKCF